MSFADIDKLLLNDIWKSKEMRIGKTIFKNNIVGEITLLNFKNYYKVMIIKLGFGKGIDT